MFDMAKTLIRHWIALFVAWLVPTLSGIGVILTPDQSGDLETALTTVGIVIAMMIYATVEKLLKPIWVKWLGEEQAGEVAPRV